MAGMGINTALLGLFSSDRKAAKQRELNIAQAMYNKEQQDLQKQYQFQDQLFKLDQAYGEEASKIVYQQGKAKKLKGTLDNTFEELKKGAARYGGDYMKYMVAEGNELLYSGISDFKSQLNSLKVNEEEVKKYRKATDSKDTVNLVMQKDIQAFNDFVNEKTSDFTFSGLLSEIDMGYLDETQKNQRVSAQDILDYVGKDGTLNSKAIRMNLIRERNIAPEDVTNDMLLEYTRTKYMPQDMPVYGKADIETSYGNELNTVNKLAQQLSSNQSDMFSVPFTSTMNNIIDVVSQYGIDVNKRASVKNGKRINSSYAVFTDPELNDAIASSVFNSTSTGIYNEVKPGLMVGPDGSPVRVTKKDLKEESFNNIFNYSTEGSYDEDGSLITPDDTYWEIFGGESKKIDARLNGFFYGERIHYIDANTGESKSALITENMDQEKAEELRANFGTIRSKETVLLAELEEKDPFRNDFYYKVIDMNDGLQASINKYTKDKDLSSVKEQNASSEKMLASKKFKEEQKQKSLGSISKYTGDNIEEVNNLAVDIKPNLFGAFNQYGLQANMLGPITAFNMLNIPDGTDNARDIFTQSIANLPSTLSQNSELSNAIKGGPTTFNSYLRKNIFQGADQYQEYLDLSAGWNTFFKNNR